ncbi:MAG: glycosyltransferase [bacterium]|nr:glycosyltransferase [bacterium]
MKVVVINPTYNERENIGLLIEEEQKIFKSIKKHEMHTLVVDDSSPDETHKVVQEKMRKFKNVHLVIGGKLGLGAAYIRGMDYAVNQLGADIIFEMDADFSHDPQKIPEFLEKIDRGHDFVIGSRYIPGGSIPQNWGIHRKIFSVIGNLLVRLILGRLKIHDWTGGFRAIRKEVFLKNHEKLYGFTGYTFQVALLYYAIQEGFKITEVPIDFVDRKYGKSKIAPLRYITRLLLYVIKARILEIWARFAKFLVVGGIGMVINLLVYYLLVNRSSLTLVQSNTIGAQLAIFSNYNLNNLWTFQDRKKMNVIAYFLSMLVFFLTSNIGVWAFQNGTIKLGDLIYGRQFYLFYWVLGTGFLLLWNFTMYSKVIWRKKNGEKA